MVVLQFTGLLERTLKPFPKALAAVKKAVNDAIPE